MGLGSLKGAGKLFSGEKLVEQRIKANAAAKIERETEILADKEAIALSRKATTDAANAARAESVTLGHTPEEAKANIKEKLKGFKSKNIENDENLNKHIDLNRQTNNYYDTKGTNGKAYGKDVKKEDKLGAWEVTKDKAGFAFDYLTGADHAATEGMTNPQRKAQNWQRAKYAGARSGAVVGGVVAGGAVIHGVGKAFDSNR